MMKANTVFLLLVGILIPLLIQIGLTNAQNEGDDCALLKQPEHGTLNSTEITSGTRVTYICDPTYTLNAVTLLVCTNGVWTGTFGQCGTDCPQLTVPQNGDISTTAVTSGTVVILKCYDGYIVNGDATVICNDGEWTGTLGTCIPDSVEDDPCCLPADRGDCTPDRPEQKWYYDCDQGICLPFKYSGCGGNENRFDSCKKCLKHCAADSCCFEPDPGTIGNCQESKLMWYFDPRDDRCKEFYYLGCGGNENKYDTEERCIVSCRSFNKNISCEADAMTATISVEWLQELLPETPNDPQWYSLNWDEPGCKGYWRFIGGKEYYEFTTGLEGCGTTSFEKPEEDRIVYTNIIHTHRGTEVFELECCYETEYTIAPIHIITNPCCVLVTLRGFGTFNITASLYTNSTFTILFNEKDFPLMICDGVLICFGIRVELHDSSLELAAEECYASESDDPQAPVTQYPIITNGCPNPDTLNFETNDLLTLHFCWDAYDAVNRDDVEDGEEINLYIHCKVHVCKIDEAGTRCDELDEVNCNKKRRAIADMSVDSGATATTFITHGPLQKSKNCQG
ncbi:uncharacterized protein LOC144436700 [Glandiceps talaboti]